MRRKAFDSILTNKTERIKPLYRVSSWRGRERLASERLTSQKLF
ncbi:hypothetical protein E2C01_062603 [Portunus trituberculatus]|uniref:Uncharacterized protein n=1 Tax=Portunus trituberculatus TaxID=210409 RepID=A0A5B7HE48_PORTR|nr:hypothetical protein [Portunus trituberculatus]